MHATISRTDLEAWKVAIRNFKHDRMHRSELVRTDHRGDSARFQRTTAIIALTLMRSGEPQAQGWGRKLDRLQEAVDAWVSGEEQDVGDDFDILMAATSAARRYELLVAAEAQTADPELESLITQKEAAVLAPSPGRTPRSAAQEGIWHLMDGAPITSDEIVKKGFAKTPDAARQAIRSMREKGWEITNMPRQGEGWYRPDAPPA
jgi:hypothetical protein